jgi:hypothetical protein
MTGDETRKAGNTETEDSNALEQIEDLELSEFAAKAVGGGAARMCRNSTPPPPCLWTRS